MTMAAENSRPGGAITGINVTPLVDITLVLLIIFMVTAKLIVDPTKAMSVDLPKAASGSDIQEIFSVVLSASGGVEVNGVALPDDARVLDLARPARSQNADLR